jgi:hypothetical protein
VELPDWAALDRRLRGFQDCPGQDREEHILLSLPLIEPCLSHNPVRNLITILTELFQLLFVFLT